MRVATVVATVVPVVVLATVGVLAAFQFGILGNGNGDSSIGDTAQTERRTPDARAAAASAVVSPAQGGNESLDQDGELVALITEPRGPVFTELGESIQLEVIGIYSDGASRSLPDDAQIAFASSAPEFVSIDPTGLMTATGDGGAEIAVTYGNFSAMVPAMVFLPDLEIPPVSLDKIYPIGDAGAAIVLNRVIVYAKDDYNATTADRIASRYGLSVIADFPNLRSFLVELDTGTVSELAAMLEDINADPEVEEAMPDGFIAPSQGMGVPPAETTFLPKNEGLAYQNVGLFEAWNVLNGVPEHTFTHVNIAVIDDGMYSAQCPRSGEIDHTVKDVLDHEFPDAMPSRKRNRVLVHKKNCASKVNDMAHGTAVVAILAAANNGPSTLKGSFSGVLSSVSTLPYYVLFYQKGIKVHNRLRDRIQTFDSRSSIGDFYHHLNRIADQPQIRVVNISHNCIDPRFFDPIVSCRNAVEEFVTANPKTFVVLSAGNNGREIKAWEDDSGKNRHLAGAIIVGGTYGGFTGADCRVVVNGRHPESNFGQAIEIAAPYCVYTIKTDADTNAGEAVYTAIGGTSYSAPLVTGTAAMLFAINPGLTIQKVKKILVETADKIQPCVDNCAGWRLLNAHAAVCETLYGLGDDIDATPCPGTGFPAPVTPAPMPQPTRDTGRPRPTDTPYPADRDRLEFSSVSVGLYHACGIRLDGSINCWGSDTHGQATPPSGMFSSISVGESYACGVRTDGLLRCWGEDAWGRASPPGGQFLSVSAGYGHTCGVRIDGSVACWGGTNKSPGQGLGAFRRNDAAGRQVFVSECRTQFYLWHKGGSYDGLLGTPRFPRDYRNG